MLYTKYYNVILESSILPETEHISKIRKSSSATTTIAGNIKSVDSTNIHAPSSSTSTINNGNSYYYRPKHQICNIQSNYALNHNSNHPEQKQHIQRNNMEFLIPQVQNAATSRQTKATLSNIVGPSLTLNDIKSHLSDNFQIIQSTSAITQHHKMTKKQLKLAQAQLDKLTQINIHLQGKCESNR